MMLNQELSRILAKAEGDQIRKQETRPKERAIWQSRQCVPESCDGSMELTRKAQGEQRMKRECHIDI